MSKRILSGLQSTGPLHLGNYLGAVQQWIALQEEPQNDCFYGVVDLHAITVRQDPQRLRENILLAAASFMALGVDPERSTLFVQSEVLEHPALAWVLGTFTQMGELERMTQYKDKAQQHKNNLNVGLFTYPVLMAADVLLYQPEVVPVGEDQKQHLELTRDIAERFNNHYGTNTFTIPEPMIPQQAARIMGLDDPTKKMSKSAPSELNFVSFADDVDQIRKKVKKAVTDSGDEIRHGEDKPAMTNLLTIFSEVTGQDIVTLEERYMGSGYGDFKSDLADAVVEFVEPVKKKIAELLDDRAELEAILGRARDQAQSVAEETMKEVNHVVGLGY